MKHVKGSAYRSQSEADPALPAPGAAALWVVFSLDAGRYALPLAAVERIVRAVHVTPLPLAPPVVLGAIDMQGRILPVFDLRHRFSLPKRALEPSDQFLIATTAQRTVALAIDSAHEVIERPAAAVVDASDIAPDLKHIRGVIPLEDGLLLIHDLEQFLSPDEARALDAAMTREALHGS